MMRFIAVAVVVAWLLALTVVSAASGCSGSGSFSLPGSGAANDVPASIDWRSKGAVTAVKTNTEADIAYAFAAAGAIEGAWVLQGQHALTNVSAQQLRDCDKDGSVDSSFKYVITNGACSEYSGTNGTCEACERTVSISEYKDIASGNESALLEAVGTIGPVAVEVEADHMIFYTYFGGIFSAADCGQQDDFGMLAVGYGTENGVDYWILKNSWGPAWGENGYMRMIRGKNQCGIANTASYPIV